MTRKNRLLAAATVIFLAIWTVVLWGFQDRTTFAFALVASASVVAGAVARDRRIIFAALTLIPLSALLGCKEDETTYCEINPALYAAVVFVPTSMALMAIGIWLAKAVERLRHRRASA